MKNKLRVLVKEVIEEGIFEILCLLTTNRQVNLTNILTDVRAIKGITTVTLRKAATAVSEDKEIAQLKIKFKPVGSSVFRYVKAVRHTIKNIDGVLDFEYDKIIDVQKRAKLKAKRTALKK